MRYGQRVHGRLVLFCVVATGVILWSLVPRSEKWEEPGPRVDPEEQPRSVRLAGKEASGSALSSIGAAAQGQAVLEVRPERYAELIEAVNA